MNHQGMSCPSEPVGPIRLNCPSRCCSVQTASPIHEENCPSLSPAIEYQGFAGHRFLDPGWAVTDPTATPGRIDCDLRPYPLDHSDANACLVDQHRRGDHSRAFLYDRVAHGPALPAWRYVHSNALRCPTDDLVSSCRHDPDRTPRPDVAF